MYMLDYLGPAFCEKNIRAIAFDSSPPKVGMQAFAGWASFAFQQPWIKDVSGPIFLPFMYFQGINKEFMQLSHARMFGETSVIPKAAHICLMHGRNDPVLDREYLKEFVADLRSRSTATVTELVFPKARHSLALIDYPEEYKTGHIEHLLSSVEEWQVED